MEKRLKEVLNREEGNYILPFFWQHGEEGGKLREMMDAVYSSGIRAVCVESRPHPDLPVRAGGGIWMLLWTRRGKGICVSGFWMMPISLPDTATDL